MGPFRVVVAAVVPVFRKVGVPLKTTGLKTVREVLSTSRALPAARVSVPVPRGPLVTPLAAAPVPAPGPVGVLLAARRIPPEVPVVVTPPVNVLAPESWRMPLPDLLMLAPAPEMMEAMARVG